MTLPLRGEKGEHMWKDLSYLEGEEVEYVRGYSHLTNLEDTRTPDRCKVIKDYGDTLLIGMIWDRNFYGRPMPEVMIRKAVPKGALYTGDVLLKGHTYLAGNEIYEYR